MEKYRILRVTEGSRKFYHAQERVGLLKWKDIYLNSGINNTHIGHSNLESAEIDIVTRKKEILEKKVSKKVIKYFK